MSHDRKLIASGSKDGTVRIWLHESSQVAETLVEHRDSVLSVEFSPSGGRIVTASRDGYVTLCELFNDRGHVVMTPNSQNRREI